MRREVLPWVAMRIGQRRLTVVCETKWSETKRKSVVCEMKICSLRNENLQFAKWESVVCEMTICSLGNDNLLSRCVYSDYYSKQKIPPQKAVSPRKFRLRGMRDVFVATYKLKLRRFWATDSNRKQDLFPFYMPWRHHICIDKCHYSYRDDLPENLPKNHCPRMQKVHFRWPLKRLILTRNVTRYSNEPIKYIIVALLFTFEHGGFNVL